MILSDDYFDTSWYVIIIHYIKWKSYKYMLTKKKKVFFVIL